MRAQRVVYIEPNNIPENNKKRNGKNSDNMMWYQEDYNMSVDLQVIIPDRIHTFNLNETNLSINVANKGQNPWGRFASFMQGKDYSDKENALTDSYINASYSEVTKNGVSNKENLGITNVNIRFDQHFYPQVTITFVDVRGYSLMMPSELSYSEQLSKEENHKNFFSTLFHFPYPEFLLTVKGHYGRKVTFQLAVNEFHTQFNSATGNFEVTVNFIGYLYGLYTDIPLNFIIAAPYYGCSDTKTKCEYWESKVESGDFDFDNGAAIMTFVEYLQAVTNINQRIVSEEYSEIKKGENALNDRLSLIKRIENQYKEVLEKGIITDIKHEDANGNVVSYFEADGDYLYLLRTISSNSLKILDIVYNFNGLVEKYNELYDTNLPDFDLPVLSVDNFIRIRGTEDGEELLKQNIFNNRLALKNAVESAVESSELMGGNEVHAYALITKDRATVYSNEEKIVNAKLVDYNEKNQDALEEEAKDQLTQALGFAPSMENIYRMLFAHVDCFLHLFYDLIDNIDRDKNNRGANLLNGLTHDIVGLNKKVTNIPPFPNVFRHNKSEEKPNELVWIGEVPELMKFQEIDFINNLFRGVLSVKLKTNEIFEVDEEKSGDKDKPLFDWYPLSETDVFYTENPYSTFEQSVNKLDDENEYTNALCYFAFLRLNSYYISHSKGQEVRMSINAKKEAYNYYMLHKKCPAKLEKWFKTKAGLSEDTIIEITKKHGDVLETRPLFHVKGIFKEENEEKYELGKTQDRMFYWDGRATEMLKIFETSCGKKLPDEKIFTEDDVETYNKGEFLHCNVTTPMEDTSPYYYNGVDFQKTARLKKTKDDPDNPDKEVYDAMCEDAAANPYSENYTAGVGFISSGRSVSSVVNYVKKYTRNVKAALFASMGSADEMKIGEAIQNHSSFINRTSVHAIALACATAFLKQGDLPFNLDRDVLDGKIISNLSAPTTDLVSYFNSGETLNNYGEALYKAYLSKNKETIRKALVPFLVDPMYHLEIENEPKYNGDIDRKNVMAGLQIFIDSLRALYDIKRDGSTSAQTQTQNVNDVRDVTNAHKLAVYESLKQLYDKWLTIYGPENFTLRSYAEMRERRKLRYIKPTANKIENISEFDNFVYIDSFYHDISTKFFMNPRALFDIIKNHIEAKSNYAVYQFMYDIAMENKCLFIAFPVYNNFYSQEDLIQMFTPNVGYDSTDSLMGTRHSTYVIMYPHEVSHMTEEDGDNGYLGFKNDGFCLDKDGINKDMTVAKILATSDDESNDLVIPAFGVTYAKQNQAYFKNITVNMDNPRITDTTLANLFYLGNLGVNGSLASPAAVGQDLYSIYSNRAYTCSVEMMGCMNIMPVMYFQLNNVPIFRGAYMITNVEHDFQPGNAVTRFTGVRMSNRVLPFNQHVFNTKEFFEYFHINMPEVVYQPETTGNGNDTGNDADMGAIISRIESDDLKTVLYTASANVAYSNEAGWYTVRDLNANYDVINSPSYFYYGKVKNEKKTVDGKCTSAPTTWYNSIGVNLLWWGDEKTTGSTWTTTSKFFTERGFKMIWHGSSDEWKKNKNELTKKLRPGDLCSQHYYKDNGAPSSHGCMYNGEFWESDFKQGDMLAKQSFTDRQGEYSYCIWRYKAFWSDCN